MAEEIERLEDHDIAAVFPLLPEEELKELAKDIKENGLRNAIALYEGKILDGRNRYRALLTIPELANDLDPECDGLGSFYQYEGDDPLGFVVSMNVHRRHLTESQRAAIATELANLEHGQRADRVDAQICASKLGEPNLGASIDVSNEDAPLEAFTSVTQEQAAKLLNVSRRSVQNAKVVKEADPELHAKVKSGEVSLNAALKTIKLEPESEPPKSWTAPEVSAEEESEVSEKTAESSVKKEPISPKKHQAISQFKKFIRKTCELLEIPKKEIEEYIKEHLLTKDNTHKSTKNLY